MDRAVLSHGVFDPAAELAGFDAASAGAVVSFTGIVRATAKSGAAVKRLFLDHHPRLTARSLREIADDAASRFALSAVRIVHRCGVIFPGEPIVFVGAAAPHRREAFDAVDYAMDRLKSEAVFWKREEAVDGMHWIEPTKGDRDALARWSR